MVSLVSSETFGAACDAAEPASSVQQARTNENRFMEASAALLPFLKVKMPVYLRTSFPVPRLPFPARNITVNSRLSVPVRET